MSLRTFIGGVFLLVAGLTALDAETSVVPEPGDLRAAGTVDFKVSGAPEMRSEFIRGVALHCCIRSFMRRPDEFSLP